MREIPTLQTERLILRAPTLDDFDDSLAMWSDPLVTRYISERPSTKEEVWARLLKYIGQWYAVGYGKWVVESAVDGSYIGEVGFSYYRRDIFPPIDGIPEMGWVLASRSHGLGLALEAAQAALNWGDRFMEFNEVTCIILPEHTRSLRVADRLGFRDPVAAVYHGHATTILRRASPPTV